MSLTSDFYATIDLFREASDRNLSGNDLYEFFAKKNFHKIKNLAQKARNSEFTKKNPKEAIEQMQDFYNTLKESCKNKKEDKTVFVIALLHHLLERINSSPSEMFMYGSMIMIVPLIERAIEEDY